MHKAQTATEYIILLGIVLIVILVGLGVVGFVPGIGAQGTTRAQTLQQLTQTIALTNYAITTTNTTLVFKNTGATAITLTNVSVQNATFSVLPIVIIPGEETVLSTTTFSLPLGTDYRYSLSVTYRDDARMESRTVSSTIVGKST